VYAQRCDELKTRYTTNVKAKDPSFITQYNSLWHLANLGRLSRMNCIWLGKRVHEMIEHWTAQDQREMLDRLQERHTRAWARWEKRIAEKQAAKAVGATKGRRKSETPAPVAPDNENDPWEG
jgi:hypothetical protein